MQWSSIVAKECEIGTSCGGGKQPQIQESNTRKLRKRCKRCLRDLFTQMKHAQFHSRPAKRSSESEAKTPINERTKEKLRESDSTSAM